MLFLLLISHAFAAELPLSADVCASHRALELKKTYWLQMMSSLEGMRQQKLPGIDKGIAKSRVDRNRDLAEAEEDLKKKLASLQSATGKPFDLRRCATQETVANLKDLPNKHDSEMGAYGYPQFISPQEAKKAACEMQASIEASRSVPREGLPKALQENIEEGLRIHTKMLADLQAGYQKRYGKKLDLATCPKSAEEPTDVPPVAEDPAPVPPVPPGPPVVAPAPPKPPVVVPAPPRRPPVPPRRPPVIAPVPPVVVVPPRRPRLDPWRLSLSLADLQGLNRQRDVYSPSPLATRDCGKRLQAAKSNPEVQQGDESYHQICRLKTGRADTVAYRFRIKRDRASGGKETYRDDFACEFFRELSPCWKGLGWESLTLAKPCKPLVYDSNESSRRGPTADKAGQCLTKAGVDYIAVFAQKKARADRGIP